MYYVPAGIFAAANPAYQALAAKAGVTLANLNWGSFLLGNLLPVTVGNILGGLAVSFIFWYCYGKK
jgi:formate/nitrite transporter FocA (FNT family)